MCEKYRFLKHNFDIENLNKASINNKFHILLPDKCCYILSGAFKRSYDESHQHYYLSKCKEYTYHINTPHIRCSTWKSQLCGQVTNLMLHIVKHEFCHFSSVLNYCVTFFFFNHYIGFMQVNTILPVAHRHSYSFSPSPNYVAY